MDDILKNVFEMAEAIANGDELCEALSQTEFKKIGDELSTPDVRPCVFDKTFQAWLYRIGLWGKVKITHNDPEFKIKGEEVTQDAFIKKVMNPDLLKVFGQWDLEQPAFDTVILFREYKGLGGKKYREEFVVKVDIKPELMRKKK